MLTIAPKSVILVKRLSERGNASDESEKVFEKAKKLLDKRVPIWYNKIPL